MMYLYKFLCARCNINCPQFVVEWHILSYYLLSRSYTFILISVVAFMNCLILLISPFFSSFFAFSVSPNFFPWISFRQNFRWKQLEPDAVWLMNRSRHFVHHALRNYNLIAHIYHTHTTESWHRIGCLLWRENKINQTHQIRPDL